MALTKVTKHTGIYQNIHKDGDITYYYSYKDSSGRKYNIKVGKKSENITPTFAKRMRDARLSMIRNGEDPIAHRKKAIELSFETVWNHFVDNKGMVERSRDDYRGRWDNHMKKYFEHEVTVESLKQFRKDKLVRLSARTVDMMLTAIGTATNYWNTIQRINKTSQPQYENVIPLLREDDTYHMDRKEINAKKVSRSRFLELDEILELKEAIKDKPELNIFVHLALSTGARLGSIMNIRKRDIRNGRVKLLNEKSGDKIYHGFIDPLCQAELDKMKLRANDKVVQLEQRPLQRRLLRVLDKLFNEGLESDDRVNRVVVHTLRHTFASHLVMNGVSLVQVKELMNHAEINTTMLYAHLAPDAGADAVRNLWK